MTRAVWVMCLGVLAGCGAPNTAPKPDPIPFALDPRGVQLLDRPHRIDFGRTDHSTLPAMRKLTATDPVRQGSCAEGGRYVAYPGGVALHFANGDFVGWSRGETDGTIQQAGQACSQV